GQHLFMHGGVIDGRVPDDPLGVAGDPGSQAVLTGLRRVHSVSSSWPRQGGCVRVFPLLVPNDRNPETIPWVYVSVNSLPLGPRRGCRQACPSERNGRLVDV